MFDSTILEVGLGLVLVYFLLSLFCTALNEWIMRIFAMRAKTLKSGIIHLLGGGGRLNRNPTAVDKEEARKGEAQADKLYENPLISGLHRKGLGEKLTGCLIKCPGPSNISDRNFALALIDNLLNADPSNADEARISEDIKSNIQGILKKIDAGIDSIGLPDDVKKMLRTMLNSAATKGEEALKAFQTSVEEWFDDAMDRVSGWYKRKAQLIILVIAVVASAALNVDTFAIADSLSKDEALRESVVAAAEARVEQKDAGEEKAALSHEQIQTEIESLGLPIGWTSDEEMPRDSWAWFLKVCGILLTALLVSLGAPFWFDLLNKIVNLRSSGNKPKKSEEKKAS